jgi:hypothetical protein
MHRKRYGGRLPGPRVLRLGSMAKRPSLTPLRVLAGVVAFVLGVLAGVGIAMWFMPPS